MSINQKQKQTSDFIICPKCKGEGRCFFCHNVGVYLLKGNHLLYWAKTINKIEILKRKFNRTIETGIDSLLFGFGMTGLCIFVIWILKIEPISFFWDKIFWLSLSSDIYFFYRLQRKKEKKHQIVSLPDFPQELSQKWEDIPLSKRKKINAANGLSLETLEILENAWLLANANHHSKILPIHLFNALLIQGKIKFFLFRLGLKKEKFLSRSLKLLKKAEKNKKIFSVPKSSLSLKKVILRAYQFASEMEKEEVGLEEILIALASEENLVKELFYDLEIDLDKVKNIALWMKLDEETREQKKYFGMWSFFKPKKTANRAMTSVITPVLDAFSQDMTLIGKQGYLKSSVGREKEIERFFKLVEAGKNAIILVGWPGVGKTNIVEEIGRRMVTEDVPYSMQDKRLVSLNLGALVAASGEGELEKRMTVFLREVERAGNIILFVEEIHNLVGVSSVRGQLDVSEILATALKNKNFLLIATSDPANYHRYLGNSALGNIFNRVKITEPKGNQAIRILEGKVGRLEYRNQIYFSYGALQKAVELSDRFIHERYLPIKALNILEEAAIKARYRGKNSIVQGEDIAAIISERLNIPLTKITEEESEKLLNLEDKIHERLVDQEKAVQAVASALRRARAKLRDIRRPITNLLFLGPTGVGKTELAKTVAEIYFGNEKKMIRMDMSEYQESDSVYRLIGPPLGKEGAQVGGHLTEAVRKNPYSLLLLDEIEKSHPDILNLFLQVMDDGRLTDSAGRVIDFTNIILISTSNAATPFVQEEIRKGTDFEIIKEKLIREKLKPHFRPEFLNRFDDIIVFKALSESDIEKIARLLLNQVKQRLLKKGIALEATDEAIKELAKAGFDPIFGARPLRRVIQNRVENSLANYLLRGKINRRDTAILEIGGKIRVEKAKEL
jgi:ATP-dependent Clp protease ATP-binding subunit ClpC